MEAAGIMLALLIGIVVFPVIAYMVWRLLRYVKKRSKKVQRVICASVLSIVLVLYVGTFHIVDKGYCIRDGKYFSEYSKEKMIDDAIKIVLRGQVDKEIHYGTESGGSKVYVDSVVPYKNIIEFKRKNPKCCHVEMEEERDPERMPPSYQYRLIGDVYAYVSVKFLERRIKPNDLPDWLSEYKPGVKMKNTYYEVSRCGEVFSAPDYWYE